MAPSQAVELVRVETADGLYLDGALTSASGGTLPVDAFLLVHGTGGNFYAPGVLEEFGLHAVAAGVSVLRVNTRGHDGISFVPGHRGSVKVGAAYEIVSDCRHDLAAWISFLAGRGCRRVVLVGHSMGGVKAIYANAHDQWPEACAVIALSPPRFCFENFQRHPLGTKFRTDYSRAAQRVAEGRADDLISVSQPLPLLITAGGFVEKYGPDDHYDWLRFLPRVTAPVLVFLGSESMAASPAFAGIPEAVSASPGTGISVRVEVVEGAHINYGGCAERLFQRTSEWLIISGTLPRACE